MKNSSGTTTDCPLCKGEKVQPEYTINNFFPSDAIGLRSSVTWQLSGTTLLQTVKASYTSDFADHYDEDCTPELNYTIPIHGLSHCPCCRRRLVESIADNDRMEITRPAKKEPPAPNLNKAWAPMLESNFKKETQNDNAKPHLRNVRIPHRTPQVPQASPEGSPQGQAQAPRKDIRIPPALRQEAS